MPWNPFQAGSVSPPWSSPLERLFGGLGECDVQGFVMPHKDRFTKTEYDSAGGIYGWNAQQGFYVYRNDRLLVAGSWLGLGSPRLWTKDEVHRLARISLDFQNIADSEWKIDIRKSIAKPPLALRARLTSLGEDTRRRARSVFANRGNVQRRPTEEPVFEAWQSVVAGGITKYRVKPRSSRRAGSASNSPLAIDGGGRYDALAYRINHPLKKYLAGHGRGANGSGASHRRRDGKNTSHARSTLSFIHKASLYAPEDARQQA